MQYQKIFAPAARHTLRFSNWKIVLTDHIPIFSGLQRCHASLYAIGYTTAPCSLLIARPSRCRSKAPMLRPMGTLLQDDILHYFENELHVRAAGAEIFEI